MIKGERVVLRAIEREDLPNYVDWLNDLRVLEYFGRFLPLSLTQEERWYESQLGDSSTCNFAIELDGQPQEWRGLDIYHLENGLIKEKLTYAQAAVPNLKAT